MPARRLVGEAYVLMRADGRLLKGDMQRAGKNSAKSITEEWDKEFETSANTMRNRFRRSISDAFVGQDFSAFRKEFGSVEATVDGLKAKLRTLTHDSNGMLLPMKDRQMLKKQYDEIVISLEKWGKAERELEATHTVTVERNKALTQMFKDQARNLDTLTRARKEHDKIVAASNRAYGSYGKNILSVTKAVTDSSVGFERHNNKVINGLRRFRLGIDRVTERSDRFGNVIGRAFGKGSRNDFLNFIGSTVAGLARLSTGMITFPFKIIGDIGDSFGTAFSASRAAGIGRIASTAKGLASVFGGKGGLIGLIGGVVVGLFAFGKILPGIVSLLTMLGGAASALVGSISIGLVGGLLAIGPASVGAIAGLGGVFGVITSFVRDEKNKDFVETIFNKPLKKLTSEVAPQIRTFLTDIRGGFKVLLDDLQPGIERFFSSFKSRFDDPSTKTALGKWSDSLGRIAVKINDAVTAFGSGLVGFFVPVLPYAERLANWIDKIAIKFDKWANSKAGQNSISEFMKQAWVDAKLVWDILGEIGSIIGSVFSAGDKTGSSFLTSIRDRLAEISAYLKDPANKGKIADWFNDVKGIGQDFGELVVSVGTIIKNLNSESGRAAAKDLMDALVSIGNAAEAISKTADAVGRIIDYVNNPALAAITDIFNFIAGNAKPDPKLPTPSFKPQTVPDLKPYQSTPSPLRKDELSKFSATLRITPQIDQIELSKAVAAIEASTSSGMTIPVKGNAEAWEALRGTIGQQIFNPKSVPVKGNEAAWNATKGTIAAYVFKPKVVSITVNSSRLNSWIAWWNSKNLNKTAVIRYAIEGRLPNGGTSTRGGVTASGGTFSGAQQRTIAEAGPEAVVPLNRPLHLVDPSVRALSAIAQGMRSAPGMAAGGIVTKDSGPRDVQVSVVTAAQNPYTVAAIVKDELALAFQ